MPSIDWKAIRAIEGRQDKGFEELCCQLARVERPAKSVFQRNAAPDAGLECFATLEDGTVHGWQSKYFWTLGPAQISQLNKSVETALDKHPKLSTLYICIPFDLADARVPGKKYNRNRWNDLTRTWMSLAEARSMKVSFELWDSFTLVDLLGSPRHLGRRQFWFDLTTFDERWFEKHLKLALAAAGPRYSADLKVDLPIAQSFDAFGRTEAFLNRIKSTARPLRRRTGRQFNEPSKGVPDVTDGKSDEANLRALETKYSLLLPRLLDQIAGLELNPAGRLPFESLVKLAQECAECLEEILGALSNLRKNLKPESTKTISPTAHDRLRAREDGISELLRHLDELQMELERANHFTTTSTVVLTGRAGTGKTHLLCDVAMRRREENRPTILLMGQQFLTKNDPWEQALRQLDLARLSAEEFLGALEAAAEAYHARALLLVDALNEGEGVHVWPAHLASFLARVAESDWITVVISVRSSYERKVVQEDILKTAIRIEHHGFADVEYDALKAFFLFYGIEWQSSPILIPDYRNPLFLKILCQGLHASGQTRIPRGMQGITAVFNRFVGATNRMLSERLEFREELNHVGTAIDDFVDELISRHTQWLPLAEAIALVDRRLPSATTSKSLYEGIRSNGLFIEELRYDAASSSTPVVMLAYERFADHLFIKRLLDRHLSESNAEILFKRDQALHFLLEEQSGVNSGQLEALCTQWPERTHRELYESAPEFENHWNYEFAFLTSLTWRKPDEVFESTRHALNRLKKVGSDEVLEVLVTVSSIPEHKLNADFLHSVLAKHPMAERDSFWSIFLHNSSDETSAPQRLIQWARGISNPEKVDDETVRLCGQTLAWMFTTPNRFTRDTATKALVALFTGRLQLAAALIRQFNTIDDLYVRERVMAAAYGAAMRSPSDTNLTLLAQTTYDLLFREAPPVHILLRDYARGIIEFAVHQGVSLDCDLARIRPPYTSDWPSIPTEEEAAQYEADRSKGSYDSGELEWGQHILWSSVMGGDFARYIIGTNTGRTNWKSVPLKPQEWTPPEERLKNLLKGKPRKQKELIRAAHETVKLKRSFQTRSYHRRERAPVSREQDVQLQKHEARFDEIEALLQSDLEKHLGAALAAEVQSLFAEMKTEPLPGEERMFDLSIVQRYIIKRVFDLGWTKERFGRFDRFYVNHRGRDSHKAERMGKKYQWIAYHEITAYLSDHFEYQARLNHGDPPEGYEGPWQDSLRDIDPSLLMGESAGGTGWSGHTTSWWAPEVIASWDRLPHGAAWARSTSELPPITSGLLINRPSDNSRWCNLDVHLSWDEPVPPDRDPLDEDRRQIWYMAFAYLIKSKDVAKYMKWAEAQDFWGRWMPEPYNNHGPFLGELHWAPSAIASRRPNTGYEGWHHPREGCPVRVARTTINFSASNADYDCSISKGVHLNLPSKELVDALGLKWSGNDAAFVDAAGKVRVYDPSAREPGASACLLDYTAIEDELKRAGLTICWSILGEKRTLTPIDHRPYPPASRMSGAAVIKNGLPTGFLRHWLDGRETEPSPDDPFAVTRF